MEMTRVRATSGASLAFEDGAPTLVLSGTGAASLPESEPTHGERITEAIEYREAIQMTTAIAHEPKSKPSTQGIRSGKPYMRK